MAAVMAVAVALAAGGAGAQETRPGGGPPAPAAPGQPGPMPGGHGQHGHHQDHHEGHLMMCHHVPAGGGAPGPRATGPGMTGPGMMGPGMLRGMMIMEPQRAAMLGERAAPDAAEIASRAKICTRLFLDGCRRQKSAG